MRTVPRVHLYLNPITFGEQCCIFGAEVVHDCVKAFPKISAGDTSARENLTFDEIKE
jgi:hypothetical protein